MSTPRALPTPSILHSKYRAAQKRIRELEEHNAQLLAGGQHLLKLEAEARRKADALDYILADVTNRLPAALQDAGFIKINPKGSNENQR